MRIYVYVRSTRKWNKFFVLQFSFFAKLTTMPIFYLGQQSMHKKCIDMKS